MPERRTKHQIIADILALMQRKGGVVKPTHILYGGNLSHDRLKTYLSELENGRIIEKLDIEGRTFYKLTDKGYEFLAEFKKIQAITEAFGI